MMTILKGYSSKLGEGTVDDLMRLEEENQKEETKYGNIDGIPLRVRDVDY